MPLSQNIKTIRELCGLSQAAFGRLFGATKDMVYSYESGKAEPGEDIQYKIAELAGITTELLKNKKIPVANLNKWETKTRAELMMLSMDQPKRKDDFKDKYIELLEKQVKYLENAELLKEISNRLNAVEENTKDMQSTLMTVFELQMKSSRKKPAGAVELKRVYKKVKA